MATITLNVTDRTGIGTDNHTIGSLSKEPKKWKRQGKKKERQQQTTAEWQQGRKHGEYDDMDIDGREKRSRLVRVLQQLFSDCKPVVAPAKQGH